MYNTLFLDNIILSTVYVSIIFCISTLYSFYIADSVLLCVCIYVVCMYVYVYGYNFQGVLGQGHVHMCTRTNRFPLLFRYTAFYVLLMYDFCGTLLVVQRNAPL